MIVGVAVAVAALLLLGGGWHLSRSLKAMHAARESRDGAFSRLQGLYQADPFPSAANVTLVRADTAAIHGAYTNMAAAMHAGAVTNENLSDSQFLRELQQAVNSLRATAPIVAGARVVPDSFAFGFDRYLTAGGGLPALKDVPLLCKQLRLVERLTREIYAAQVTSLVAIRREEFEAPAAGEAAADDEGSRKRRDRRGAAPAAGPARASAAGPYRTQHFTLELTGSKPALIDLLNRLARIDTFVVVGEVEMRKTAEDIRTPPAEAAAAEGGKAIEDLPHEKRLVTGPDIDPPLSIRIELDVYSFEET